MSGAMPLLQPLGRTFLNGLESIGRFVLFAFRAVWLGVRPPYYPRLMLK